MHRLEPIRHTSQKGSKSKYGDRMGKEKLQRKCKKASNELAGNSFY
jgi:hypothetical protein